MKLVMQDGSLPILYRDDHMVAVHKPAGLLVHRSWIDPRETRFALQLVRDQIGRMVFPVHRLDKPTSGVLLFALNADAARMLGQTFARNEVEKTYLAVVRGVPSASGLIDHPLREEYDRHDDPRARAGKAPQPALTRFRTLAAVELPFAVGRYPSSRYALVQASPETGRKHQLRRHFKHLCHPLIGDTKYGEGRHNRFFRERFDCRRLLLAAVEISLPHPVGARPLTITAPLEDDFARLLFQLGVQEAVPARFLS
ncbi:tRNA pseudouridine(65) synthase TruC [Geoalkalibacter halelectricus]|uniref:tRNA pseudouridine synthase C n=1 Tax=Geoalkalibacter halelectricus TaxID=2847045 RepID=A0ABY5ZGC8_9BACT|nr:tRNA pseudouridine(65) synthase TruC [Geoalkalibacter halelectricus]MDO3380202.1 tRNA pseudouridine(65) synthase TruC [Geoalkalibacter halelectricus]UWZ78227.1 tRNA pseudouridine(65) synthase TruC [Geoalkalibacter halelectricus]